MTLVMCSYQTKLVEEEHLHLFVCIKTYDTLSFEAIYYSRYNRRCKHTHVEYFVCYSGEEHNCIVMTRTYSALPTVDQ